MKNTMNSLVKKARMLFLATALITSGVNAMEITESEEDRVFPDYHGWVEDILALRKSELVKLDSMLAIWYSQSCEYRYFYEKKCRQEEAYSSICEASYFKAVLALVKAVITELNTSITDLKKATPGSHESSFLSQKSLPELITALKEIKGKMHIKRAFHESPVVYALTQETPLAPGKRPKK